MNQKGEKRINITLCVGEKSLLINNLKQLYPTEEKEKRNNASKEFESKFCKSSNDLKDITSIKIAKQ